MAGTQRTRRERSGRSPDRVAGEIWGGRGCASPSEICEENASSRRVCTGEREAAAPSLPCLTTAPSSRSIPQPITAINPLMRVRGGTHAWAFGTVMALPHAQRGRKERERATRALPATALKTKVCSDGRRLVRNPALRCLRRGGEVGWESFIGGLLGGGTLLGALVGGDVVRALGMVMQDCFFMAKKTVVFCQRMSQLEVDVVTFLRVSLHTWGWFELGRRWRPRNEWLLKRVRVETSKRESITW